jgi:hypothetical protein
VGQAEPIFNAKDAKVRKGMRNSIETIVSRNWHWLIDQDSKLTIRGRPASPGFLPSFA